MTKIFSTIIVDDEPLARKMIKEYLQDFPEIEIAGECTNGKQAVKAINEDKPDIVFLDIRMPGMDGFEVLEHLDPMPRIIFTTAYGDYALKAFEVNAADYLLKPYDKKRFSKAIQRVIDQRTRTDDEIETIVRVLQQSKESGDFAKRIFVRVGRKILSVQLDDILWIEADGDYTRLHTNSGTTHLCDLSLNSLEQRLDSNRFVRVHRSHIIAANSIEHLEKDGEGGFVAFLRDGAKVRVSRTHAARFRKNIW
jgi:two-component system LytT family response regulator